MRLVLIITTILFYSCGKESEPVQGCTTETSTINKVWTSDKTSSAYDIRNCTAGQACDLTYDGACDGAGEITITYNGSGGVTYTDCSSGASFTGNWRVCSNVMEFYNFNDAIANDTFR